MSSTRLEGIRTQREQADLVKLDEEKQAEILKVELYSEKDFPDTFKGGIEDLVAHHPHLIFRSFTVVQLAGPIQGDKVTRFIALVEVVAFHRD